jgi:hypothetical protein
MQIQIQMICCSEAVLMHKRHVVLGGTQGTVTLVRSPEKILSAGEIP